MWCFGHVVAGPAIIAQAAESTDLVAARRWVAALRASDPEALITATAIPFTFGTTNRIKKCEGTIKAALALSDWVTCVRKAQGLLIADLNAGDDVQIEAGGGVGSKALTTLAKKVNIRGTWVRAFLNGDGVSYSFRFLTVKKAEDVMQVAAFLVDADYERP